MPTKASRKDSPCVRSGCPCTRSWNGKPGHYCCKTCQRGTACKADYHSAPADARDQDDEVEGAPTTVSRFALPHGATLCVTLGSVVEFRCDAIVNAADTKCIKGKGVDGAINEKGGAVLLAARKALPIVEQPNVRCPVGEARITIGGGLPAKWCIHAVGPNFNPKAARTQPVAPNGDQLLRAAYLSSMHLARDKRCETVAFSLLSSSYFRGDAKPLHDVVATGVAAIRDGAYPGLREVHLMAFKDHEARACRQAAAGLLASVAAGAAGSPSSSDGSRRRKRAASELDDDGGAGGGASSSTAAVSPENSHSAAGSSSTDAASASGSAAAAAAVASSPSTSASPDEGRRLRKQLRRIDMLKKEQEQGKQLGPAQLEAVAAEEDVYQQLAAVHAAYLAGAAQGAAGLPVVVD